MQFKFTAGYITGAIIFFVIGIGTFKVAVMAIEFIASILPF